MYRMREWKKVKSTYEDRLGIPAGRGVPIGSYRDRMGALDGAKKLAFVHHQELPI